MAIEYAGSRRAGARPRRFEATDARTIARRFDWLLLGGVAGLIAYGLHLITGITQDDVAGAPHYYVIRQGAYAAVGGLALIGVSFLDPDLYRRWWRYLYGATLALLLIVFPFGAEARGSQRWISLGSFQFQPSELVKLLVVLAVGGFLAERARRLGEVQTVLGAIGLTAVPTLLVFFQPDVGTSLVYCAALGGMLFVVGARWLHLGALLALIVVLAGSVVWLLPSVVGVDVLEPYQMKRLTAFVNRENELQGAGYNVEQSILAIGAGGLRGRGVENATQTNLDYLPEHATDFAFASLAEQRGFFGAALLLLLYLLVVWRGLRIVTYASDPYTAIVSGGLVLGLLFQIFVNIGMTMGMAPVTGIPLPFVSVGGSSLVTNLLAIGVLQAIHARGRKR
ncbi:MAG TPA: rod shape-determining protein RodA [Gaiellaceae bacterium]|nr:rod shape-determining protein RodA [Gaiellaceae bacterium]